MKVFISYATEDIEKFRIPELAQALLMNSEINEVFYWQKNSGQFSSLIKYMEECISICDVLIAVSSGTALQSKAVEQEIDLALYQQKRIIPLFDSIENVRPLLKIKTGVKFDKDLQTLTRNLLLLILTPVDFEEKEQKDTITDQFMELFRAFKSKIEIILDVMLEQAKLLGTALLDDQGSLLLYSKKSQFKSETASLMYKTMIKTLSKLFQTLHIDQNFNSFVIRHPLFLTICYRITIKDKFIFLGAFSNPTDKLEVLNYYYELLEWADKNIQSGFVDYLEDPLRNL